MSVDRNEALRIIDNFQGEYEGIRHLKFKLPNTQEEIYGPEATPQKIGKVYGAYHPSKGEVVLPVANMVDSGGVSQTVRHEVFGHYGINTFAESEKRQLITAIEASRDSPTLASDWAATDKNYANASESIKAEEIYARSAESIGLNRDISPGEFKKVWTDVVLDKKRSMTSDDLAVITEFVADGIRRDIRPQQIFPKDDHSQYQTIKDIAMNEQPSDSPAINQAERTERFRIETVKSNGQIVNREFTDDAEKAMRSYVELSKPDFGKEHGPGSYVALTDNNLKLDAAKISEGHGTYRVQFGKQEGREAFDATVAKISSEPTVTKAPLQSTPEMAIDSAAIEQLARARSSDSSIARESMGLNTIEPDIQKQQQKLDGDTEAKRSAWLSKAEAAKPVEQVAEKPSSNNKVESDEIFTASQSDVKAVVPPDIEKQYLRVGDKFYHSKNADLVAFEDKGNKLETKSNSENIAESMVRIAEARGWDEIKVSGSETFRKEVWLEAASRGMHVKGYAPSEQDKAELGKRVSEADANKIEKDNKPFRARESTEETKPSEPPKADSPSKRLAETFANEPAIEAVKKYPELAGAIAAVAVMDKQAETDGLTPAQRAIVSAQVRKNIVNSIERGELPQVSVKEEREIARNPKEDKEYVR